MQKRLSVCLTFEVFFEPLVLRLSPLLEFLLKMSQELSGDTWERSEDGASCRAKGNFEPNRVSLGTFYFVPSSTK